VIAFNLIKLGIS